jgi:hypothetical protein
MVPLQLDGRYGGGASKAHPFRRQSETRDSAPAPADPHSLEAIQLSHLLHSPELDRIAYSLNAAHQATRARAKSVVRTAKFDQLALDIEGFASFLGHARCLGVLLFWKESLDYARATDEKERVVIGQRIHDRYLQPGGEWETSALLGDVDKEFEEQLAMAPPDLFATLHEKAFSLMASDLWHRFWDEIQSQAAVDGRAGTAIMADTPLSAVLNDPKEVAYLAEFARQNMCEEQVLFWLEASEHKLLFAAEDLLQTAQTIFDTYVSPNSVEQVTLPGPIINEVERQLKTGSVPNTLFDAAIKEVEKVLTLEVWPKYVDGVVSGKYDPLKASSASQKGAGALRRIDAPLAQQLQQATPENVSLALRHPHYVHDLHRVAMRVGRAELIDFASECHEYVMLFDENNRRAKARTMFLRHVVNGASNPVELSEGTRRALEKVLRGCGDPGWQDGKQAASLRADLFERANNEVLKKICFSLWDDFAEYVRKEAAVAGVEIQAPDDESDGGLFTRLLTPKGKQRGKGSKAAKDKKARGGNPRRASRLQLFSRKKAAPAAAPIADPSPQHQLQPLEA